MESYPPPIPSSSAAQTPPPPRRSPWGWIFGLLFFGTGAAVLCVIGLFVVSIASAMKQSDGLAQAARHVSEITLQEGGKDKIAHIDLEGIITASTNRAGNSMVDNFAQLLEAAVHDSQVKAIVIRINSPGGEVTASDRLHQMIQRADAVKPVVAYMDTIAASGGYYSACGARHLMAHPTTFTGSIGVIMQSMKYSDLLDKVGLQMEIYKSGKMKDLLSGTRETSPEETALVNELITETYDRFLEVVAENRGRAVADLRGSTFTDGRIFSGKQGFDGGFVDSNGFITDAYQKAADLAQIHHPTVVRYQSRQNFFDFLEPFASAQSSSAKLEIDVSERLLPKLQSGVPLYLHLE
jgi:protease-4